MAVLTYSDISSGVESNNETLINRLLEQVEDTLSQDYNLTFVAPSSSTVELIPSQSKQGWFEYWFFDNISELKIKEKNSGYEKLLEVDDYQVYKTNYGLGYAIQIDYYKLTYPCYLSLTADLGFSESVPRQLKNAIIDHINRRLVYINSGYRMITQSKTNEVDVTFDTNEKIIKSIENDKEFLSVLNHYLP